MEEWWCGSAKVIAWLWGDPRAINVVREYSPLLEPQGYTFILPDPRGIVYADVAIMPPRDSPEWRMYNPRLIKAAGFIYEDDPEVALFRAIAYPRREFLMASIGIDPGRRCGLTAVADGVVLKAFKVECSSVGRYVKSVIERLPSIESNVYIGDGPGLATASASLEAYGVAYTIMGEYGTTRYSVNPWRAISRDRDIIASLRIAYMGAYSGGFNNKVHGGRRGKKNR